MQKPYRIGDRVCVRGQRGYRLPAGLRDGQQVTVIAFLPAYRVVETNGRRFAVPMATIRPGLMEAQPLPS